MQLRTLKLITALLGVGFLLLLSGLGIRDKTRDQHTGERSGGICTDIPQFSEYSAPVPDNLEISPLVDFSTDERALTFTTKIQEWFERGVQSGAYYAVAEWGCGTSCQDHAIIDVRTGEITWFGLESSYGIAYKTTSNLLVINPPWNVEGDLGRVASVSTEFYELQSGVPRLICRSVYEEK